MVRQSKITISFSREYQDVYEFLCAQVNASGYVCKVIRERMGAKTEQPFSAFINKNNTSATMDLKKAIDSFDF